MTKAALFFILISTATAQQVSGVLQFDWEKLAAKAVEKTNINLDGSMLQMASKFLSGQDDGTAKIRQIVQGLKGIYVKTFEFDKEGQYTDADVNELRSQLRAPEWSPIVESKEKRESSFIFMKTDGKQAQGIVIISAEPKEFTVVQIIGVVDPSVLSELGGKLGIPRMEMGPKRKTKKDDD